MLVVQVVYWVHIERICLGAQKKTKHKPNAQDMITGLCRKVNKKWPPGLADTVCPRPPLMTQAPHFFPELRRGRDETYRLCERMTLTFDLEGHDACGWCGSSFSMRIASLKFVGLAIRKIWPTMCVSINRPGDPDLWPFDLEAGVRVASKVGTFPNLGTLGLWVL